MDISTTLQMLEITLRQIMILKNAGEDTTEKSNLAKEYIDLFTQQ